MKLKFTDLFAAFKNKYILSLVSNGINSLIGMITLAVLLRALSLDEMGEWGLVLTVILFMDTFRSGFLSTAFIKFYSGTAIERQNEIAGSSWFIAIVITLILLVLNIPAYLLGHLITDDHGLHLFIKYFGLNYLLALPFFMATCVLQARQRFDQLLILNFTNQGGFLVFILITMGLGKLNINTVIFCYILSSFMASLLALICKWTMISEFPSRRRETINSLFHFGKFNMGTNIVINLMGVISTFIVKFYLGAAALAIYNAGTKLIQIVELPLRSVVYTAAPSIASSFNEGYKADVIWKMQKNAGMLTLALVPVCTITFIFAELAIDILGGAKYVHTEAPNILRIFMFICLFYPIERFLSLTLDIVHLPKINFLKVILTFFITILGYYISVHVSRSLYGLTFAYMVTTFYAVIIGVISINRYYLKFNFFEIFKVGAKELTRIIKIRLIKKS